MASESSHVAVVDDRDLSIQYSGAWSEQGGDREFGVTTKTALTAGPSATFKFVGTCTSRISHTRIGENEADMIELGVIGTSVTVFGTIDNRGDATMTFQLDNDAGQDLSITQASQSQAVFHQVLWQSNGTLADQEHTLVMTHKTDLDVNSVIFLDYITYAPTDSTDRGGLEFLLDDRDPTVKYSTSGWNQAAQNDFLADTATFSQLPGSSFELDFEGTPKERETSWC